MRRICHTYRVSFLDDPAVFLLNQRRYQKEKVRVNVSHVPPWSPLLRILLIYELEAEAQKIAEILKIA